MKISTVKRLSLEDYPEKELNKERLFGQLNEIFQSLISALRNNLTFGDNFNAQVKTIEVKYNTSVFPYYIKIETKTKPIGVILLNVQELSSEAETISEARGIQFEIQDVNLKINNITNLTEDKTYKITLLILGS